MVTVANDAKEYLQTGKEIPTNRQHEGFVFWNFRQLTQSRPNISVPITSESRHLLSVRRLILQRWKAYFDNLLNKPVVPPSAELSLAAQNATTVSVQA